MEYTIIIPLVVVILILLYSGIRQSKEHREIEKEFRQTLDQKTEEITRIQELGIRQSREHRETEKELRQALDQKVEEIARIQELRLHLQHKLISQIEHTEMRPPDEFPILPPDILHDDDYWSALSNWYRQMKGWTCEVCKRNLEHHKFYLDTHHIHGRGYNSPQHLKALCVRCHAEQTEPIDHSFMKQTRKYQDYMLKF